jgi:hypothetical protein
VPFTKWYRVWERTQLSDFRQEMIILPFVLFVLGIHLFGARTNRRKAHDWAQHHGPALEFEFASVGFGGKRAPTLEDVQSEGLLKASADDKLFDPEVILKENAPNEYVSYATGRANTAFVDIKLSMIKRYNPLIMLGEAVMGFLFDSAPQTIERMEASSYAFDGKESSLIPRRKNEAEAKSSNSTYDGFVWAIVHKNMLKRLRDDRYDLSITATKDHAKLPAWVTVLTENGEITETLLTPELIKAVEDAGDLFDALIISDQPMEKPSK